MVASENRKLVAVRAFPRRLDRARKEHEITNEIEDYTWARVADALGLSTTVMSQIKTGQRPPTLEEVVLFAHHFGVRASWLAFEEGPMLEGQAEADPPNVRLSRPATSTRVDGRDLGAGDARRKKSGE